MGKNIVAIVKYKRPRDSVRRAVELSRGLEHLPPGAKVFIKPNIVFWTKATNFPKYGVITTSRVVEDMVVMLKERGIDDISIGEGTVLRDPKDMETQLHAFKSLGYFELEKRYGVKYINIWERPYDLSLCTYCSGMTSTILAAIAKAWKGEPWDDVEILSGKVMKPEHGKKKTILFGKCMYQANKDNPEIKEMIAVKGCPPKPEAVYQALQKAGVKVDHTIFDNLDAIPGKFLKRYKDRPEFDESFFTVG